MRITSYKELKIWQRATSLALLVYKITALFPKEETYGLISQLRRAAVSIPSNIAEGHARDSTKEYLRHVSVAFGSLAEVETQIYLAKELEFMTEENYNLILNNADELGKMLRATQRTLKNNLELQT